VIRCKAGESWEIRHCLQPCAALPALSFWTEVTKRDARAGEEIGRFDAVNLALGGFEEEPSVSYLLGWLYGPRVDAPGRHTVPYAYPSWIPGLLYGDQASTASFARPERWHAPLLRLIKEERLTRLPLRSGKRSTFENFPWAAVRDPVRGAGFFAGFSWSGTWKMDIECLPGSDSVSVRASMDGYSHPVAPGTPLVSPRAFLGFFEGDWDDAYNATRRYVTAEILPPVPDVLRPVSSGIGPYSSAAYDGGTLAWKEEVDASAAAGVEDWGIDAAWWAERFAANDFSLGLGCFEDNRGMFRQGLKAVSDYVHSRGMRLGLWFEIERADIRTANRGPRPWRPEWLVHHNGYPHRSWCQHVYSLCLGVKAAQDWAIDNISWAIREYGVDHVLIDSNEWAVCDDTMHGHGARDGEWAQIEGLYRVFAALRAGFPGLMITNLGGGSQRSDFGMARFTHRMCPADVISPTPVNRKYAYGIGAIFPVGYSGSCVAACPGDAPGAALSREELEWRCINAMAGGFSVLFTMRKLDPASMETLKRATSFARKIRATLWGDRYVLAEPVPFLEQEDRMAGHQEPGIWEAYEYLSPGATTVSLFAFRCMSRQAERTFHLRGLDPAASYRVESFAGSPSVVRTGASLVVEGIRCTFPRTRQADIFLLSRAEG
jgi:hypothetical protein